jgi:ABC-type enterobactin transport system permease subunit
VSVEPFFRRSILVAVALATYATAVAGAPPRRR